MLPGSICYAIHLIFWLDGTIQHRFSISISLDPLSTDRLTGRRGILLPIVPRCFHARATERLGRTTIRFGNNVGKSQLHTKDTAWHSPFGASIDAAAHCWYQPGGVALRVSLETAVQPVTVTPLSLICLSNRLPFGHLRPSWQRLLTRVL